MQSAIQEPSTFPVDPHAEVIRLQECLAESEQQRAAQQQALEENRTLLEERAQRIEQLLDLITVLKRKRFGRSADVISPDQLSLFDEAELEALIGELQTEVEATGEAPAPKQAAEKPKGKPVRRPLPEHLPRVDRIIDLSEDEKQAMGPNWTFIGYDEAEQLAIIPRQPYIIVVKRAKYAPLDDSLPGVEPGVVIAPRAPQILPKAIAHSSLLADVVVGKFVDALPLYRQEKIWAREGIDIPRQTMAGWMIQLDLKLVPLMAAMKTALYQGRVIHIDETRLQVLNEPGREATQKSFMWVYCGGTPGDPVIWFQYAETRSGEVPKQFLFPDPPEAGGSDPPSDGLYLLSDGYCAYMALALQAGIIGHAACWAHVRRKFVEAAEGRKHTAAAHQMVALIRLLYAVERDCSNMTAEERKAERERRSKPILDKIKAWLDEKAPKVLPKGLLGMAIAYTLELWLQLNTFLEDGHIEIDNNIAENAIRPFVIGRKNFLFSGSPRGAAASATLYSLIETAKANGLEPRAYLLHLFEQLPKATTPEEIAALLPMNLKPEDLSTAPIDLPLESQAL